MANTNSPRQDSSDGHERRVNHGSYKFARNALIVVGFGWLALTAAIVYNGDVAYGLLYTGPALITWLAAYVVEGMSNAE